MCGGKFIQIKNIIRLVCEMQRLRSSAAGVESQPCRNISLEPGESITRRVEVQRLQDHVTFSLNWTSEVFDMWIFRPSQDFNGFKPFVSRATRPIEVTLGSGDTNLIYKIPNPESGLWHLKIFRPPIEPNDFATSQEKLPAVFGFSSLPAP